MNRLTKKSEGRVFQPQDVALAALILKLSQYEDSGLEPEEVEELLKQKHNPKDCVVKDGEWVAFKDEENGRYRLRCSICGATISRNAVYKSYCPNCGSKLEEKV